jgi:hypothetical protein
VRYFCHSKTATLSSEMEDAILDLHSIKAVLSLLSAQNSQNIDPSFALDRLEYVKMDLVKLSHQIDLLMVQTDKTICSWQVLEKNKGKPIQNTTHVCPSTLVSAPLLTPSWLRSKPKHQNRPRKLMTRFHPILCRCQRKTRCLAILVCPAALYLSLWFCLAHVVVEIVDKGNPIHLYTQLTPIGEGCLHYLLFVAHVVGPLELSIRQSM